MLIGLVFAVLGGAHSLGWVQGQDVFNSAETVAEVAGEPIGRDELLDEASEELNNLKLEAARFEATQSRKRHEILESKLDSTRAHDSGLPLPAESGKEPPDIHRSAEPIPLSPLPL